MDSLRLPLRPRNPSWIWIRYIQYATTGTTLCHPQNWLYRCDASFRSWHLALISPLGQFNGGNAHLSPKSTIRTKLTVTPKFISSNGKQDFRLTTANTIPRTSDDTRCYLNFLITLFTVSLLTTFPTRLAVQKQTTFSMQIKTIPKNISTSTSRTFSFIYFI